MIGVIVGFSLMLFGFIVRSQMISYETNTKYGMRVMYVLCLLFFGFMPFIGIFLGTMINVINLTELHYGKAEQTNKLVLLLSSKKIKNCCDKIDNFLKKPIF